MEELTPSTLIAVFEEMFGGIFFWVLVAAAVLITLAYLYVLIRDRSLSIRKFFWAQMSMPFGAIGAVTLVLSVTNSALSDIGGPIDLFVIAGIAVLGAIGISILVYTLESFLSPPSKTEER